MNPNTTPDGQTPKASDHTRGSMAEIALYFLRLGCRANSNVQGFVKEAFAAAIGTILGASFLLGKIAIGDRVTAFVGIASLAVLFRWKVNNPLLIALTAVVDVIAFRSEERRV